MAEYKGTVKLIAGITQTNGDFALVNAPDIQIDNTDKRLNTKLSEIDSAINLKAPIASPTLTGTPKSVTPLSTSNAKMIATKEYVDNAFTTNDAMLFKGVVTNSSGLPATHKQGWTYKVAEVGTYAGVACEVGDMIICNTDGTSADNSHWNVIQTNMEIASAADIQNIIDGTEIEEPYTEGDPEVVVAIAGAKTLYDDLKNKKVTGPASSTNNRIALFDGTTGKLIKQSSYTAGAAASKGVDTNFNNTSSTNLPTTQAVATELSEKANKTNPQFTGYVSLVRDNTTTPGENSVALGRLVEASGEYSFAEGTLTHAIGKASHAEGYNVDANGDYSHAEGADTTASGVCAHVEGRSTKATGNYSHAEGEGTTASAIGQHSVGRWNIVDGNNSYVEIVGNGTDPLNLSNARTLDWDGNEYLAGDVYVNCNSSSANGSKVVSTSNIATISETQTIIDGYVG